MFILKAKNVWHIILILNVLCIHHARGGITSYFGSFFGYGKTTTTPPPPLTLPAQVIPNQEAPQPVVWQPVADHIASAGKYIPIVYYIPTEDLYKQSFLVNNEIEFETAESNSQLNFAPWYHLTPTKRISTVDENIIKPEEPSDSVVPVIPTEEVHHLPGELRELADKLGLTDTRGLPSISELRDILGFSTDQEAIDFVLDLASSDYGLNLIKSFISEQEQQLTDSYGEEEGLDMVTNNDKSDNNEPNDVNADIVSDDMEASESNIMSVVSRGRSLDDDVPVPEKKVVRRQNDAEAPLEAPRGNPLKASLQRAKINVDVMRKILSHPFHTGFFGTLKHWTGYLTKNVPLQSAEVQTVYGPKNEEELHFDTNGIPQSSIVVPEGQQTHYVQYPDGHTYMINPIVFDQPPQVANAESPAKGDDKVNEISADDVTVKDFYFEDKKAKKADETKDSEDKQQRYKTEKIKFIEDNFRLMEDDNETDSAILDLEASSSLRQETKVTISNFELSKAQESDLPSPETVTTELTPADTTITISTTNEADPTEKIVETTTATTITTTTMKSKPNLPQNPFLPTKLKNDEQRLEDATTMKYINNNMLREEDEDLEADTTEQHMTIVEPPAAIMNRQDERDLLDSIKSLRPVYIADSRTNSSVVMKIPSPASTDKITVLKPVPKKLEWKPQRVSGPNPHATGRVFRVDPSTWVVPNMIMPAMP